MPEKFRTECERELQDAEAARLAGNEGRARVCARRAAGLAARAYLLRVGLPVHERSAFEALKALTTVPGLAPELKNAAVHLTLQVNGSFNLPVQVDLIMESRKLIDGLLKEA